MKKAMATDVLRSGVVTIAVLASFCSDWPSAGANIRRDISQSSRRSSNRPIAPASASTPARRAGDPRPRTFRHRGRNGTRIPLRHSPSRPRHEHPADYRCASKQGSREPARLALARGGGTSSHRPGDDANGTASLAFGEPSRFPGRAISSEPPRRRAEHHLARHEPLASRHAAKRCRSRHRWPSAGSPSSSIKTTSCPTGERPRRSTSWQLRRPLALHHACHHNGAAERPRLEMKITAINTGTTPQPVGIGWRPRFAVLGIATD